MEKTKTTRRSPVESAHARETVYHAITATDDFEAYGYKLVGMGTEGLLLEDLETGFAIVLKAIAKATDFDIAEDIDEATRKREEASKAKAEKEAKKAKKEKKGEGE